MVTIIRKDPNSESFSIEIVDGDKGAISKVAQVGLHGILPEHGTPREYANVILNAVSNYMQQRSNIKPISLQKAREKYSQGGKIFMIDPREGLTELRSNSMLYDNPSIQYYEPA